MKTFSWNCRGLGNQATVRALRKLLQTENPDIVFLMESKLKSAQVTQLNFKQWGFSGCFSVDCITSNRARKGGLCVLWRNPVDLNLTSYSEHHISLWVTTNNSNQRWLFTGVYGWPEQNQKWRTWQLLRSINPGSGHAWLCVGDFNEILWPSEKIGGNFRADSLMNQFRSTLDECGLNDLGYGGYRYTWSNGQSGADNIQERLDRALATEEWCSIYSHYQVSTLPRIKSDHMPILIEFDLQPRALLDMGRKRKKLFRFEQMWLQHESCEDMVRIGWRDGINGPSFAEKTQRCGQVLQQWEKEKIGSVSRRARQLEAQLGKLQTQPQTNHVTSQCRNIEQELNHIYKMEEVMWLQRSRISWLREGDRNTSFFHKKASQRRARNKIERIQGDDGQWCDHMEDVCQVFKKYFIDLFTSDAPRNVQQVLDSIEVKVSDDMNQRLSMPFTEDEVYKALQQMHPSKAPGPDEGFSSLLSKAERQGDIHGFQVARRAPAVSHLFFADDSILFFRATIREGDQIAKIIDLYEEASGQKINLDKSELFASGNVSQELKHTIGDRLGVRGVEQPGKYLGLPALIGRSKRQVFQLIQERVLNKIKGWKEKLLSRAGKEILLKAVVQAIPTYTMSCFLFPIYICKEIEKAIARFWWGYDKGERRCHWVSWEKMTVSKEKGGLGFREIHCFNMAMIAKQYWRLRTNPNSIAAQTLKAKYFPRDDIDSAHLGYQPSFLWRSILAARPLIENGTAWRVGNGTKINIRRDRWIGVEHFDRPQSVSETLPEDCCVASLINHENRIWDVRAVRAAFDEEDANRILGIPLSFRLPPDKQVWRCTKSGKFTVKSAYHLAVDIFSSMSLSRATSTSGDPLWKKIWNHSITPKVKHFLWRACTNSLPTKDNLARRGCVNDPICLLCGDDTESISHLILRCNATRLVWYFCPLRIDMATIQEPDFNSLLWHFWKHYPPEFVSLFCILAWNIWSRRNQICFQGGDFSFQSIIQKALNFHLEFQQIAAKPISTVQVPRETARWIAPPEGILKLNSDAAIFKDGLIGLGFVLRNHHGELLLAGHKKVKLNGSSTLAEGIALCWSLQKILQNNLRYIQAESDCCILINGINGLSEPEVYLGEIVEDILLVAREIDCNKFTHVSRNANSVAHALAHFEIDTDCENVWNTSFPPQVSTLLPHDVTL